MKNLKECPKCKGKKMKRIEMEYTSDNGINIKTGFFTIAKVNRYVCVECGYIEFWAEDEELEKIRKGVAKPDSYLNI